MEGFETLSAATKAGAEHNQQLIRHLSFVWERGRTAATVRVRIWQVSFCFYYAFMAMNR